MRSHLCRTSLKSGRLSWPAEPTATFTRVGSSLIYAHGQKESDVQREPTEDGVDGNNEKNAHNVSLFIRL